MSIEEHQRVTACRSDDLVIQFDTDIEIVGSAAVRGTLRAGANDPTARAKLIESVRAGAHAELHTKAITFRQKPGVMNRRKIRIAENALDAMAKSFVGMPMLLDHDARSQRSRMGSITSSETDLHGGTGWTSFRQGLHVVKPEGVISVLDGTIDRFSIGWLATGPVLCTIHGVDVRSAESCDCWPGDTVMIDGKAKIAEYEFQSAEGIEVSAVNVPAVTGTKIEDIRPALAAELNLSPHRSHRKDPPIMRFPLLAAALGLAALDETDEARAVDAVKMLQREKLAAQQERDVAQAALGVVTKERDAALALGVGSQADALIEGAYRDGKLKMNRDEDGKAIASPREARLRKIAKEKDGLAALKAEIAEMPIVVPIGQRVLVDDGKARAELAETGNDEETPVDAMANAARQLGHDPQVLSAYADGLGGKEI